MFGGLIGILGATNEEIESSLTPILLAIIMVIFVFCAIVFRSLVAPVLLIVPLLIANALAYAYMAINHIGMDVNTLPIASVGMGLGVDYGIYYMSRIKEEYKKSGDLYGGIRIAAGSTVKAIFYTAFILTFSVLVWYFTNIKFLAQMGFLLGILMMFNCLGAILWQPAIVYLVKPRFITGIAREKE